MATHQKLYVQNISPWLPIRFLVLFVSVCSLSLAASSESAPQLLYQLDSFSTMKTCAQNCFWTSSGGCITDELAAELSCPFGYCKKQGEFGAPNGCYCRADNMPVAGTILSSCIKSACTVANSLVDISSALSLYSGYCSSLGFQAASVEVPSETTADSGGTMVTTTIASSTASSKPIETGLPTTRSGNPPDVTTPPTTVTSTSTSFEGLEATNTADGTASPAREKLARGDKIALGVGLGIGIPALLVALVLGVPPCLHAIQQLRQEKERSRNRRERNLLEQL
ncbi:hypothetical protein P154DRAFT_566076 [Amniculicola lignicola CBS 123094]|uniref:Extracellular membrane protein CFEM domain-containing protein n=1 Tax=Amniculicola lignicola CBS 123094 TaxID=1392246 RepID=A0A6A5W3J7_9PLEO|nr:hypothetical protein P154DRAFT_566076 [Amniculicola lignicola CBS 123094]